MASLFVLTVLLFFVSFGLSVPVQTGNFYRATRRLQNGRIRRVRGRSSFIPSAYTLVPVPVVTNDLPTQESQQSQTLTSNQSNTDEISLPNSTEPVEAPIPQNFHPRYLYQIMQNNKADLVPLNRYRTILPSPLASYASNIEKPYNELGGQQINRDARIFDWLFGRPSYSRYPYPNYSMLESAAGGRYPSYGSRPYGHHGGGGYVVEECTEMLDPITHEIFEDCYEVY